MIDYTNIETTPAIPDAGPMIETLRAIGYSVESAIADVVDNSISAGAKNVHIDFDYAGSKSWLSILDDGTGMSAEQIVIAMKPGSQNPNDERSSKDLGRFGLGLKTASFSQCRLLTVLSAREQSAASWWSWDLDYVRDTGEWNLVKYKPEGGFIDKLSAQKSGTLVLWENMDRLITDLHQDENVALDKFLVIMKNVMQHLSMVFHRYIDSGAVNIWMQQRKIEAWDPYMFSSGATQKFPVEPLYNGRVKIRGFVLPHKSKLTDAEFRQAEGPKGWNAQQGFYIYRNERLLVAGDWLGLFRKEEHYKLARIMIDLPNTLDKEWQIDIRKSVARAPLILKENLKSYGTMVRNQAVEVYRHKGKVLQRKFSSMKFEPVWLEKVRHGKRFYEINREHPLIIKTGDAPMKILLRLLEESVPVPLIVLRESEDPDSFTKPFENAPSAEITAMIRVVYDSLLKTNSEKDAKTRLHFIEPFNEYPELIETL
jgi:hypothetical protein